VTLTAPLDCTGKPTSIYSTALELYTRVRSMTACKASSLVGSLNSPARMRHGDEVESQRCIGQHDIMIISGAILPGIECHKIVDLVGEVAACPQSGTQHLELVRMLQVRQLRLSVDICR